MEHRRNIVPVMLDGFNFGAVRVARQLTGRLEVLKSYNGLAVPPGYFGAAMQKLREEYLHVLLSEVVHPALVLAPRADSQPISGQAALAVEDREADAQEWIERAEAASDLDEKIEAYSEAIRLRPDDAILWLNRGDAHLEKSNMVGAEADYSRAIDFAPNAPSAFKGRALAREDKGDRDGALRDFQRGHPARAWGRGLLRQPG